MDLNVLKDSIRNIPDFPVKGIQFKDLTTAFKQAKVFEFIYEKTIEYYKKKGITKVVAIESRGFILGGCLALGLHAGFVPVRKPGKLPAETYKKTYSLEYGEDTIEIHKDALSSDDIVLIHDDLLATGGTANATVDLIRKFHVKNIYLNFITELGFLKGRSKISSTYDIFTLLTL